MTALRLALAQYPITAPTTLPQFWAKLDAIIGDALDGGAQMLVLPEYACMEVAACFAGAGDPAAELHSVSQAAPELLAGFRDAARRHRIWLLPGTVPRHGAAGVVNSAPLIAPDGLFAIQEKSVMTRFEAESWGVTPGAPPRVFATDWGRIGIAICYDVEFPALVRAQAEAGAWLILAPSCTDSLHGFNRVRLSARARALENQCFVGISPTVGVAPTLASVDENHGYAALFGPVDRGFPADGVIARGELDEAGLVFADLDPASLAAVRHDGAVRNFRDWPAHVPPSPLARLEDPMSSATIALVQSYYAAFNRGDAEAMLALLTDDVRHDINQGATETGIDAFRAFMARMNGAYREQLADIVVMAIDDGTRAAAEFTVHGEYLRAEEGLPAAHGQTYILPAGAFFTLRDARIARVSNFYNLPDWLDQVSDGAA